MKPLKPVFFALVILTGFGASAQTADSPRPMGWKDVSTWQYIPSSFFGQSSVQITPDGKWVGYPLVMAEGDGKLIVKKVNDTIEKKYPIGERTNPAFSFSHDGKWLAYKEYPTYKEVKANKKTPDKRLFEKLHLVNLLTGEKKTFERTGTFSFNKKASTHLAISLTSETRPKPNDPSGNDLLVVNLSDGKSINIGNVGEFSFNKTGELMAYTIDAANKTGNGLYIHRPAIQVTQILDNDKTSYKRLNWHDEKDALTVLKMTKDEKFKTDKGEILAVKNLLTKPETYTYSPIKDTINFPKGMTISGNRSPYWNDDLTRVIFGINTLEAVKKEMKEQKAAGNDSLVLEKIKADSSIKSLADLKKAIASADTVNKPAAAKEEPDLPDMVIWHWKDKRLQSAQQVQERMDKNFHFLAAFTPATGNFIQLSDSAMKQLIVMPKGNYGIGTDIGAYELETYLDGQNYIDLYIVDLKTGSRKIFRKKFYQPTRASFPTPSPDGTKFIFGEDGQYYSYDISTGKTVDLTSKLPTTFVDLEDDHNIVKPMNRVLGWSSDSRFALVSDGWDIWQIAADGSRAENISLNGTREKLKYQMRFSLDPEEKGYDYRKPQYFRVFSERGKQVGIALARPGKNGLIPGMERLLWEDVAFRGLQKAENADVYLYTKERSNEPVNYYVANAKLNNGTLITKNAPDAKKYQWGSDVRIINYVSDHGDSLTGALFLPPNYVEGRKYPTIVYYYEKTSQDLYSYTNPSYPGGGWNQAMYTSNGYAVFKPDIVYKLDDPGMSAVACVIPAVKEAIKTGIVDPDNMGLQGHSWGGYQTAFLVTQTNMFKAAAAGAALTDMVNMYNLIYWNSGMGNMSIFEASQGRFRGAPWENWESYYRNSPMNHVKNVNTPLLLLHNDKDGAVDFTQGVVYYNALRRLQKPVVMMQYKGENHGLNKLENRKDYAVRMMEFFDHFLKGKAAPDWWTDGVDYLKLEEHLKPRAF